MRFLIVTTAILFSCSARAQFPAQAGQAGSTALHKDSSVIVGWAQACVLNRGFMNVANPSLGSPTVGDSTMPTGKAGTNGVVSLGDGGTATLTFASPVINGTGPDFAVFENGFLYAQDSSLAYLELAYVEVSSDGINFVRFSAESVTDTVVQVGPYETLNASKIHNLAGKYVFPYGTPFDLEELKNEPNLDVNHVTHIRIVDVTGSLNPQYAQRDKNGNMINDPWPTDFPNGGFDLDAVAVIHQQLPNGINIPFTNQVSVFPNPAVRGSTIYLQGTFKEAGAVTVSITGMNGCPVWNAAFPEANKPLQLPVLAKGIYFVQTEQNGVLYHSKLLIQ